jgi:hypothetical protein
MYQLWFQLEIEGMETEQAQEGFLKELSPKISGKHKG